MFRIEYLSLCVLLILCVAVEPLHGLFWCFVCVIELIMSSYCELGIA